jgi:hypothetical protein
MPQSPGGRTPSWRAFARALLPLVLTIAAVVPVVAVVFSVMLGFVADLSAVLDAVSWPGVLAIALFSVGVGTLLRQHRTGRLRCIWSRRHGTWLGRCVPVVAMLVGITLAGSITLSAAEGPSPGAGPGPDGGGGSVPAGCSGTDADQSLTVYSHSRLAAAEFQDIDVDVRTGGYVQQRFIAQSRHISSVAVIISRPVVSDQRPFDKFHMGRVRLTIYRADSNGRNVEPLPITLIGTGDAPTPDGVAQSAGENHKQTVFRICPIRVEPGERYAFRVTNEEPDVVLAFSLSTEAGPTTSMDIIGTTKGQDRTRINYHQVAGYVCSIANC